MTPEHRRWWITGFWAGFGVAGVLFFMLTLLSVAFVNR